MDPSEENIGHVKPARKHKKRSFVFPVMLFFALLFAGSGIAFFLYYQSDPPLAIPEQAEKLEESKELQEQSVSAKVSEKRLPQETVISQKALSDDKNGSIDITPSEEVIPLIAEEVESAPDLDVKRPSPAPAPTSEKADIPELTPATVPVIPPEPPAFRVCSQPVKRLNAFYTHLDHQPYMKAYGLQGTSQEHFAALIEKLLAHPPKVTRESDDLYTILQNTAHFFRISGKNNIVMLQGILNAENKKLEQILADYYFLISTPECAHTTYGKNINTDDLYEYGCFFLNTMGGRLYLFRRDSISRMVVTYYAILLVDDANDKQNNRHGINLRPAVNMLLSEMQTTGSNLKYYEKYLDMLYDLKEKYQ